MGKTREIRIRMKAVSNIRRITRTMQMIATSKFSKAQLRATATKPYTEGVFGLVTQLGATAGNISHPLIAGVPGASDKPELLLVMTSDRGLCGAYNGSVLRTAMRHIRSLRESGGGLETDLIGKKGVAFFRYNDVPVSRRLTEFGDEPRYDDVERLAQGYMDRFIAGEISRVSVIYMRFISAGRQRPEVLQLLPLKAPEKAADASAETDADKYKTIYEFSPDPEELLNQLLPEAVKTTLFQAMNDAIVSEHIARMVAMKSATDNAAKMGKLLTRQYNRARQAQITTELTEIVTGAAALE